MKLFLAIFVILFIVSLESEARIKLNITNSEGQQLSKEFDTQAEADAYALAIAQTGKWGAYTLELSPCGNTLGMVESNHLCPTNFTVSTEDITAEYNVRLAAQQLELDIAFGKDIVKQARLFSIANSYTMAQRIDLRNALSDALISCENGDLEACCQQIHDTTETVTFTSAVKTDFKSRISAGGYTCP